MEINLLEINGQSIAKIVGGDQVVRDIRDALDLLATAQYQGATTILMAEKHLPGEFFDLRTGLAGEILQKCANYRMKLAVVGAFEEYNSKSLEAFMIECNRGNSVFFVKDRETGLRKIAG